ncbi:MAG: hypothetical protein E7256_00610 [Lachnospiraceae bacterium]|nr:hypothetical protein [Lachnospiraceae bacterium]
MRCPSCKSERIIKGRFRGNADIFFVPDKKDSSGKEEFPVEVYVCQTCGMIVNLGVTGIKNYIEE